MFHRYVNDIENNKCFISDCEKATKYRGMIRGYNKYCSSKCATSDPDFQTRKKSTLINTLQTRYNVTNIFCLEETKKKSKKTWVENLGYDNPNKSKLIRDKIDITNEKIYGYRSILSSPIIRKRIEDTNLVEYGSKIYITSDEFKNTRDNKIINKYDRFINNESYTLISYNSEESLFKIKHKCCSEFTINTEQLSYRSSISESNICTVCNPIGSGISLKETELYLYICSIYNGIIIRNDRTVLNGKELDIYLPELRLGIEFNGNYWHSTKFFSFDYHQNKSLQGLESNIDIIHIFESDMDDIYKSNLWKKILYKRINNSYIDHVLYHKRLDYSESVNFLYMNHIYYDSSFNESIGLYKEDILVCIILLYSGGDGSDYCRIYDSLNYSIDNSILKYIPESVQFIKQSLLYKENGIVLNQYDIDEPRIMESYSYQRTNKLYFIYDSGSLVFKIK